MLLSIRPSNTHDEHVLGQPTLIASNVRSDTKGKALLSEKGVASVARAERPDLALSRAMGDHDLLGVAWPVVDDFF